MAVQCSEPDEDYPPPLEVAENRDPHDAPIGGIQRNQKPRVYISHTKDSHSLTYVKYLRDVLIIHLGYQEDDILSLETGSIVGVSVTTNITKLVKRSKKMIVVISKEYTSSTWTAFETAMILKEGDISNADIIPIISDDGSTEKDMPDELSILIPLHAKDKHFIKRLGQSLEYSNH